MEPQLKTQNDHVLPLNNPIFSMSALTYSSVEYNKNDHHLHEYSSQIDCSIKSDTFNLLGRSLIQDTSKHSATGEVRGSVFIYNGTDKKVLCNNFHSKKWKIANI